MPASATADRAGRRRPPDLLDAVNPATRELIGQVFVTDPDRVPALVARASHAARAWGDRPFRLRAEVLVRLRRTVAQQAHEIAETIARGMGKPLIEALPFEVARVLETIDDCIARASADLPDAPVAAPGTLPALLAQYRALLQPLTPGAVVFVIAPVTAPFHLAIAPAIVALAAGNAVIVKGSSSAPLVGVLVERLFDSVFAVFPGLAQVVHGRGELGSFVARLEGVDAVIYSGSTPVGRQLQAELAALQRPAFFQLGGSDPLIVCEDANLERAANAAVFGRFSNNGQGRAAVTRVYVQHAVADAFLHKVVHKVRALKSGPYTDPFCELGPLANGRHLEHLRAVLEEALDRRARLAAGGWPAHVTGPRHGERRGAERQGWYWPPTVIKDVDPSMRVMQEALFGPILPIHVFENESEAIALANDTAFGFDASIFSADPARTQQIGAGLHAGSVIVNDVALYGAAPVATAGAASNENHKDREPHWFPYSAAKLHAIEQAMARRREV